MKKSTSLRKSALITSVIMLLVAVTALSGATYAWFSSEPAATTNEITMTTTAIRGLYLAESNLDDVKPQTEYSSFLNWKAPSGSFAPVSSPFQGNTDFFTTSSKLPNGTYEEGTPIEKAVPFTYSSPDAANGSYFARKIWLKGDVPAGETRTIVADFRQDGQATYHRIAIIDVKAAGTIDAKDVKLIGSNGQAYNPLGANGVVNTVQLKPSTEKLSVNMGTITGDEVKEYLVFFYFEGQDATCTTANSGKSATAGITFRFAE